MVPKPKSITIYTDGACLGNPGPGGWGVVLLSEPHRKELSGGYRLTTNNRMELLAAIEGLQALKSPCNATLITDSQYVFNGMEKGWARRWREKNWMRNRREKAQNADLWQDLLDLCERHRVRFEWVRGHAGNVENERCDRMAQEAARRPDLPPDPGYRP